jgi:hypothetical protein
MVEVTLDAVRGYRPLRNEKPRMGVRGSLGRGWMGGIGLLNRTMICCTPVPESRFPNSEFRMAYGGSGIPHHEIA